MKLEKGQVVYIKYGTYHNPENVYDVEPVVLSGKFERLSAGEEYAVIRVGHLPWPFTHLHVRQEDLET